MNASRLLFLVVVASLVAGVIAVLGSFDEPEAPPVEVARAPETPAPPVEVTAPQVEVAEVQPARPHSPLAPLPPDPIADRIAAGEKLYTLHAEVLDNVTGQPVKLFRTWLVPHDESVQRAAEDAVKGRTWGNPLGTLTYRGLEEGTYDLLVRVDGYEELHVPGIVVPTNEEKLSFTLSRGAFIEVTVNDFEGDGIGNLEVRLNPIHLDDPSRGPRVRLRFTDDYGKALFTALPSGTYSVAMGNPALAEFATQEFHLGPGVAYPVTFTVPTLNTVRVKATDPSGNPLNLVQVRMWSTDGKGIFRAETDRDGQARLEHVPAGTYTVKLYKYGCRRKTQDFEVAASGEDVPFEVQLVPDWDAAKAEENPTREQLEKLKAGARPHEVFTGDDG